MHPSNSAMTARTRGWFHPLLALAAALPAVADAVPATRPLAVPLAFEENRGQSAAEVDFLARGAGYGLFLAGGEAVFVFAKQQPGAQACTLRLRFEGARPAAPARGELPQAGRSHYLSLDGSRPPLADVPRVGRVRYSALLPGTDLLFYGRDGRLEYDLELAPGRSAHPPVLRIEGAGRLSLREDGALAIDACGSEVAFEAPVSYQLAASGRVPVESRYRLLGGDRATFELGAHRADLPLVIDPVFSYSTCLAGSGDEEANDVALASSGEVYIVGTTTSADFPTRNPIHGYGGGQEVFITKLNATGTDVVYSTYAGANADHQVAEGVAVNSAGEAFVSGTIYPADGAPWQAFLLKLNAAGNGVAFSRVFGGSSYDQATEVALDSSGNAVVVGTTDSSDFPLLNALQTSPGGSSDGFVRRYSTTGTLLSSTYFGGTWDQRIESVVVGPGDNIWVAGRTDVVDFSGDAFVAKLNSTASSQVYNRRFGGAGQDWGLDLAVDAGSRAYLVGRTASADFPVANAIQPNFGGDHDGFLTVLDSAGSSSFVTSTYLGNSDFETAEGVALGPSGEVYATGSDGAGSAAAFLLKLGNTFNSVVYSVQIQPTGYSETGNAVRVDGSGAAYLVGKSYGGQYFPTTPGAYQACMNGGLNAFAAKIVDGTPQLTVSDVSVTEGNSGTVNARFTVSVDRPPLKAVTFSWATSDGSATSPADFQSSWGSGFSIGAGKTSATVDIQVNADTLDEPNETFSFDLSAVVGATVVDSHAVGTILDDDDPPALSIGDATVTEGNSGSTSATFTVSLSAASGKTVTVAYATANGSAVAPADYAAGSGTLTFNPGQTSTTFAIAVAGDALDEINETFSVNLSSASNATIADGAGLGTILDDDAPPALSVDNGGCSVTEGNSGSTNCNFVLRLSAASGKTVSFSTASANGSAASGSDYTGHGATARSIAAGQTTLTVAVPVLGDTLDEDNESFTLNVSGVANATPASLSATGTISDDDNPPVLSVDNGGCSVTEGNSGSSNCNFVLRLSAVSSKTVNFSTATANGSATSGSDYTGHGATARSIAAGQTTLTVAVPVLGDTLDEANESFSLNVSGVANATPASLSASGSITDDDAPPVLSVDNGGCSATEGNSGSSNCNFVLRLSAVSSKAVSFSTATANGSATSGSDYTGHGATARSIAAGQTTLTVAVPVLGDTLDEDNETFVLNVSGVTNAMPASLSANGSITDDDAPPVLSVDNGGCSVTEGNSGSSNCNFVLRLSAASGKTVSFSTATANGSAASGSDYTGHGATARSIAAGQTTLTVAVPVLGDTLDEDNESFTLNVSGVANATPASLGASGSITDDDAPPVLSVDNGGCSVTEGNSGSTNCSFVLRLSAASGKTVSFSTATANGSATSGSDYTGHGATARSIAAGQTTLTVAVPVLGDTLDEANESFSLNVSGVANATPTSLSASGSIIDDDDAPALPQVSIEPASVIEGDVGDVPASFRVRLDPPATATVTVGWSTSEETATEAIDYRAGSGTLTFAPGESEKFIVVQVIGDTQVEPDEFFIVGLDSAINAELDDSKTAGSILDDDLPAPQPGVVSLQAAQISISENDGSVALAVLRSGGSDGPATVRVRSADGSASAPADYAAVDAVLAWAAGDATTREVLLTPVAADGEEADETFTLTLIEVTGATLGVPSQATVTLLDGQRRVFGNGFE